MFINLHLHLHLNLYTYIYTLVITERIRGNKISLESGSSTII